MSFLPSLSTSISEASRQEQEENDHYSLASSDKTTTCMDPLSSVAASNQQQLQTQFEGHITPPISNVSHLQPILHNVISTVNLCCQLDLKRISLQVRNAEYNPKRFAAVIMRIRKPRTTALIFGSGKMVCTGARSEEDSLEAARRYARVMQKLAFPVKFRDFKIQNMVGSVDVKFPIRFQNIERIALEHHQFCSYEPEVFPGLIYRMIQPKVVLLIFVSGKVVLVGN
ncbi:unnamed protein product [Rotaria sordida]|uniref:TATA-box-binding protein n=1 Tax=Rotaria sordida TaxID=392033 RepID=A0A815JLA6_9BILA|nr:unnamed protein product [Rotaria sordida]